MRYPDFLKEDGTIGFVAPSFGCTTEPYRSTFLNAQNKLHQLGYHVQIGENCFEDCGIGISNTPQKCGEELNKMYCSEENDVLISCGGGELMCEILEYVDFEHLKTVKPKWYLGYSDNTNFTFLQTTLCDTASIYGPCAGAFGMEPWHEAIQDTLLLLEGKKLTMTGYSKWEKESLKSEENPLVPYHVTESTILKTYVNGQTQRNTEFSGRLIGGCIDCLVNLLGTQYDNVTAFEKKYQKDGFVWFLESCDLNVMSIRRAMWQMDNAGWFQNVRGFVIGRPLVFGQEMMGLNHYEAVMGILRKYQVPVVMDADIGHLPPSMPIICGSYAKISTSENEISVSMELKP